MVEFPLPEVEQRELLVKMYFEQLLLGKGTKLGGTKITVIDIGDAEFKRIAEMTDGYSGRAISKLLISVQVYIYLYSLRCFDRVDCFASADYWWRRDMCTASW